MYKPHSTSDKPVHVYRYDFFYCISYLEQLIERIDRAAGWTTTGAWFDSLRPLYRVFTLTSVLIIVLR
jgi:hypothetical protein